MGEPTPPPRFLAWLGLLRPDDSPRWRQLVLALFCAGVVMWIAALAFMSTVPFSGDELYYTLTADALASYLRGSAPSFEDMLRSAVSFGWFMPGVSIALTPLYLVVPEPSVATVRICASALIFLLWIWSLREISATFGRAATVALLIFPMLAPMWLLFASTVWGDLPGGLFLAIALARTVRLGESIFHGDGLRLGDLIALELILVGAVYLRGNALVAVGAIHIFLLALCVIARSWSALPLRAGKLAAGGVLFASLLAPWSVAATHVLGSPVITTSTAPLSLGMTFGDTKDLCFGPCPERGNAWMRAVEFSRAYAEKHGVSELEVQREMAARALEATTFASYTRQVRRNFTSYLFSPARFATRFVRMSSLAVPEGSAPRVTAWIRWTTLAPYLPFLACLAAANLAVVRTSLQAQLASLGLKMMTLCLFLQPFIHPSHPRYWPSFAPLMAISAGLIVAWMRERRTDATPPPQFLAPLPGNPALTVVQTGYVAFVVAVAAILIRA